MCSHEFHLCEYVLTFCLSRIISVVRFLRVRVSVCCPSSSLQDEPRLSDLSDAFPSAFLTDDFRILEYRVKNLTHIATIVARIIVCWHIHRLHLLYFLESLCCTLTIADSSTVISENEFVKNDDHLTKKSPKHASRMYVFVQSLSFLTHLPAA